MAGPKQKKVGNGIFRAVIVGISLLLQVGWLLLLILKLNQHSAWISLLTTILSALVVLRLYSKNINGAYKLAWIVLIMAFPIMGLSLYLINALFSARLRKRSRQGKVRQKTVSGQGISPDDPTARNLSSYLAHYGNAPLYANTQVRYFSQAVDAWEQLKEDLRAAQSFIFMEYFILEDDRAFGEILDILAEKAASGVEVRVQYDDVGSIGYVNLRFALRLNQMGIHCRAFNPALPVLNLFMNHRDHRKIAVIDGKIGHTGGYNLANEYFGFTTPYGHWKDTGIRLEGEGVRSLTAEFLELWNISGKDPDSGRYLEPSAQMEAVGFVQPFSDDPLGEERLAENVYLNLISQAREFVWFMTPYLMITDEMRCAMGLAAKRGVDVRIITPGIPDKKPVYHLTRSYYSGLAGEGVRIFEYSPGFCHAKQCLCDGKIASIGTSNLDYRSLYLHFENNVVLYDCPAIADMQEDFLQTFRQCREVTDDYRAGRSKMLRLWQCILRLFAPMM